VPVPHLEYPKQILRFSAQRPKVLEALQCPLIGSATGPIVCRPKEIPVNKLASHVIIVPLNWAATTEKIDVAVSAIANLLDEAKARF
jgi:hypothetical protein